MNQRILVTLACALLASCAMGPDYERPELDSPEDWREVTAQGESIANMKWWELFEDENLTRVLSAALANNRDLGIAVARIEEARATLGFVRADQYPGIDGQAGVGRGNTVQGLQNPGGVGDTYVLAANLSFELDLWGKLRRSTEAARAELLATVEARNIVTITLISDVASTYLLLLDLDNRVGVAQRTLETRRESLDIIQARFDRGIVPLLDVNQAQIELADAQAELSSLEREDIRAENLLSVFLGQNPGNIIRGTQDSTAMYAPDVPVGLPSELLERRPDVRQSAELLHAQTARIGVAEALRWPSLSLTGTLGLASDDLSGFVSSDNKIWSLNANLLGPVFDAGRNRSRVEAEIARTEQLLLQYESTVLRAFQEVEDALVGIRTYRDEAGARNRQMEAARSAAGLSRARYDGGVTSYLEVLESERSLFRAELLASSVRREQLVSVVLLYKALGGGWVTDAEIQAAGSALDANTPPASNTP
jgi:multidrug efflux system outer membrane protein